MVAGRHCLTFQFTLHHKHYLSLTPDAVSVPQSLSLSLSVSVPLSLSLSLSFSLSLSLSALPLSLSVSFFLLVCHSLCQNNIILVRYKRCDEPCSSWSSHRFTFSHRTLSPRCTLSLTHSHLRLATYRSVSASLVMGESPRWTQPSSTNPSPQNGCPKNSLSF